MGATFKMLLTLFISIFAITQADSMDVQKREVFQKLTSWQEFYIPEKHYGKLYTKSEVTYIGTVEEINDNSKEVESFVNQIKEVFSRSEDIYAHTHSFQNKGDVDIRILFSNDSVILSPLTALQKDFAFTLKSGEYKKFTFWAPGEPSRVVSQIHIAHWSGGLWNRIAGGTAGLYIPSHHTFYLPR